MAIANKNVVNSQQKQTNNQPEVMVIAVASSGE